MRVTKTKHSSPQQSSSRTCCSDRAAMRTTRPCLSHRRVRGWADLAGLERSEPGWARPATRSRQAGCTRIHSRVTRYTARVQSQAGNQHRSATHGQIITVVTAFTFFKCTYVVANAEPEQNLYIMLYHHYHRACTTAAW